jgi:hypothetical protein
MIVESEERGDDEVSKFDLKDSTQGIFILPQQLNEGNNKITYSEIVCNIIVASLIPNPAPPSSSGNAIPIHPSAASLACNSKGYSPDSSRSAQYS